MDDPVTEANPLRTLASRCEEHLRRRQVRVLFHEVVLRAPHGVEAQRVGELYLVERLFIEAVFAVLVPGSRELELVEKSELSLFTLA